MWRMYQLVKSEAHPDSYYNAFSTGDKNTLNHPTIREDLMDFHKKWYSSNLMKLVVYGNQPIDQLETWVDEKFSPIQDYTREIPCLNEDKAYSLENMGNIYKVIPVQDSNSLTFKILLDRSDLEKMHYTKPLDYHSFVLGHEGKGSLLSSLIEDGLATGLTAYQEHNLSAFSFFNIKISLTEKGVSEYENVIRRTYSMLNKIRDE